VDIAWKNIKQSVQGRNGGVTAVQCLAPAGHRKALIEALRTTVNYQSGFTANEIGLIYQANWERDFSQGSPRVADLVLAWNEIKRAAASKDDRAFSIAANDFQKALKALAYVSDIETEAQRESLGGYRYWEHADQPSTGYKEECWKEKGGGLPAYLLDARAYLKEEIVRAVDLYRTRLKLAPAKRTLDPWSGVNRPEAYGESKPNAPLPTLSREVIASETERLAKEAGVPTAMRPLDPARHGAFTAAATALGRASHVLEDFFSHSNFLELSKQFMQDKKPISPGALFTGKFEEDEKIHALGHKIVGATEALLAEFPLLLRALGQAKGRTDLPEGLSDVKAERMFGFKTSGTQYEKLKFGLHTIQKSLC
jgi:hypothetical protein